LNQQRIDAVVKCLIDNASFPKCPTTVELQPRKF